MGAWNKVHGAFHQGWGFTSGGTGELCLQRGVYSARSSNPAWLGDMRSIRAVGSMVCVRADSIGLSREL